MFIGEILVGTANWPRAFHVSSRIANLLIPWDLAWIFHTRQTWPINISTFGILNESSGFFSFSCACAIVLDILRQLSRRDEDIGNTV